MSMSPADVSNLSVWDLYSPADCSRPDEADSPGARFLGYVRDEVVRVWQRADDPDDIDETDESSTIADGAPDSETHTMWKEFVDLGAYSESPEYEWSSDLTEAARQALLQIAYRLAHYLFQELMGWYAEQEEDDDDDEEDDYPLSDEW